MINLCSLHCSLQCRSFWPWADTLAKSLFWPLANKFAWDSCGINHADCMCGFHCANCIVQIASCGLHHGADCIVRIALCGLHCADCIVVRIVSYRLCRADCIAFSHFHINNLLLYLVFSTCFSLFSCHTQLLDEEVELSMGKGLCHSISNYI